MAMDFNKGPLHPLGGDSCPPIFFEVVPYQVSEPKWKIPDPDQSYGRSHVLRKAKNLVNRAGPSCALGASSVQPAVRLLEGWPCLNFQHRFVSKSANPTMRCPFGFSKTQEKWLVHGT